MMQQPDLIPEKFYFEDDGVIPNSRFPLLIYRNAFIEKGITGAEWVEKRFQTNAWYNFWRGGIYPFHHYHSMAHEALGIFQGFAELQIGGEKGIRGCVFSGDILVIPAGTGHKLISASDDFCVVGAYPNGMGWDLIKEDVARHDISLQKIADVPFPSADPVLGPEKGLVEIWGNKNGGSI